MLLKLPPMQTEISNSFALSKTSGRCTTKGSSRVCTSLERNMYCTKIPYCFPFYNDDTTIKKGTCNTVVATVFLSLKRTKNNKLHCILQSTTIPLSSLQSHIMTKVSSSKNRGTEKVIFVQGRPCVSPSTACVH